MKHPPRATPKPTTPQYDLAVLKQAMVRAAIDVADETTRCRDELAKHPELVRLAQLAVDFEATVEAFAKAEAP